ncbi:MAG TPA: phosphatidate cytidylyltransferase [Candidatus Limnocylindrales bacterium]
MPQLSELSPLDAASLVLVVGALLGLAGASLYAIARRGRATGLTPRMSLQRAGSYVGLAVVLLVAARAGVPGITVLFGLLATLGLLEWAQMFDLPAHHRIAVIIANAVIFGAIAVGGVGGVDWLVAGIVLVGAVWPVIRADTGRAIRDLGMAAVGMVLVSVLLVHAVALAEEDGEAGIALVLALAVACAFSDVGAFVVGRTFGRTPLAPRLSPNKTLEGVIGNVIGAAVGLIPFLPALVPTYGLPFVVALVPLVACGSLWGDLLESAAKREAGVKDAGHWLPGFGGILDRIDSLLITVALGYWITRLWGAG